MKSASISISFKPITNILRRYHLTLFIVFVAIGLGFAVFTFTNILGEASTDSSYQSPINAGTIDQATLERIKALHTSDDNPSSLAPPSGRINPFVE